MITIHKTRSVLRSCFVPVRLRERRVTVNSHFRDQVNESELERERHYARCFLTGTDGSKHFRDLRFEMAAVIVGARRIHELRRWLSHMQRCSRLAVRGVRCLPT
jgi:Holliday junction resolvase-like predicted endonuclease